MRRDTIDQRHSQPQTPCMLQLPYNASSLVKSLNSSQIDSNSSPILGFVVTIDDCHSDACLPAAINHRFHFFPWKPPGYTHTTFHA